MTDAQIIAASLEDPEVFAGLFDRHYGSIARFLRRRVEPSVAEQLASETFLRAFDGRGRYDQTRPDALPWLFGIASNLVSGHRRSERRRLQALARLGDAGVEDFAVDAADRLDAAASSKLLVDRLASMRPDDRDVLLLFAWADLNYEQIALALAIPVGTVRSRLNRARGLLRAELDRRCSSEPLTARQGDMT